MQITQSIEVGFMNRFLIALVTIYSVCSPVFSQAPSDSVVQPPKQANREQTRDPSSNSTPQVPEFIIGAEDVLFISVWHEPDFTQTVFVRSDGKISFPLLGDVQASGLSANELQTRITEGLDKFVHEPQVTVIVQEIHSYMVHVIGSVPRPGMYDIRGPTSIMQLLARAGGLADYAKPKAIVIVRTDAGKIRRFRFDYDRFVSGENFQQNISLHAGDVIIVP
jgi:polysaccharide export outer membrane protein